MEKYINQMLKVRQMLDKLSNDVEKDIMDPNEKQSVLRLMKITEGEMQRFLAKHPIDTTDDGKPESFFPLASSKKHKVITSKSYKKVMSQIKEEENNSINEEAITEQAIVEIAKARKALQDAEEEYRYATEPRVVDVYDKDNITRNNITRTDKKNNSYDEDPDSRFAPGISPTTYEVSVKTPNFIDPLDPLRYLMYQYRKPTPSMQRRRDEAVEKAKINAAEKKQLLDEARANFESLKNKYKYMYASSSPRIKK
jgi:hypothetical protein